MKTPGEHGPAWTRKKFDTVWKRYESGVPASELAKEHGCTTSNIYKRLRKVGYSPDKVARKHRRLEVQASKIYTLRKQGRSFDEVAVTGKALAFGGDAAEVLDDEAGEGLVVAGGAGV